MYGSVPGECCVDITERISELNASSRNIPATILESGAETKREKAKWKNIGNASAQLQATLYS